MSSPSTLLARLLGLSIVAMLFTACELIAPVPAAPREVGVGEIFTVAQEEPVRVAGTDLALTLYHVGFSVPAAGERALHAELEVALPDSKTWYEVQPNTSYTLVAGGYWIEHVPDPAHLDYDNIQLIVHPLRRIENPEESFTVEAGEHILLPAIDLAAAVEFQRMDDTTLLTLVFSRAGNDSLYAVQLAEGVRTSSVYGDQLLELVSLDPVARQARLKLRPQAAPVEVGTVSHGEEFALRVGERIVVWENDLTVYLEALYARPAEQGWITVADVRTGRIDGDRDVSWELVEQPGENEIDVTYYQVVLLSTELAEQRATFRVDFQPVGNGVVALDQPFILRADQPITLQGGGLGLLTLDDLDAATQTAHITDINTGLANGIQPFELSPRGQSAVTLHGFTIELLSLEVERGEVELVIHK